MNCKPLIYLPLVLLAAGCHKRDPHVDIGATGPYDQQFLIWLADYHNDGDRMLGPCAEKQSVRRELRDFCGGLDQEHQQRVDRVTTWLKSWYGREPPAADRYRLWLASLEGPEFEHEFLKEFGRHLADGITEMTECAERAQRPELKELCARVVPRQKENVVKMNQWKCGWFKDCD